MAGKILKIFGQAPTAIEPRTRPFHNPACRSHGKAFALIPSWDDLEEELGEDCGQRRATPRPLIRPSREQLGHPRKPLPARGAPHEATVPLLKVGRMHDRVPPQSQRSDQ